MNNLFINLTFQTYLFNIRTDDVLINQFASPLEIHKTCIIKARQNIFCHITETTTIYVEKQLNIKFTIILFFCNRVFNITNILYDVFIHSCVDSEMNSRVLGYKSQTHRRWYVIIGPKPLWSQISNSFNPNNFTRFLK